MKILSVVGARPNFMKVAPIHRALLAAGQFESRIVHTGQHYDQRMSDIFFRQLEMPEPDVYLGIGSGTHAAQTARVMMAFEEVLAAERPDLVLVVGDVNSTLACSLVAVKECTPVAHVEAGLRSGDRRMPEEINRIVTDSISDLLFVTEQSGLDNLKREGVPDEKVFFVGNVMIDSLVQFREKAAACTLIGELGVQPGLYALLTMHRPANVDHAEGLQRILRMVELVGRDRRVIFPIHPRTRQKFRDYGLLERLENLSGLTLLDPLGYIEFLHLMEHAAIVVTDSGGVQEETTFLNVPCLTLRENTERPVTIHRGSNELIPYLDPEFIAARVAARVQEGGGGQVPELWDGRAAERITEVLSSVVARGVAA